MKLLTNNLETAQALAFHARVDDTSHTSYVFAGRPTPWVSETAPDPVLNTISNVEYDTFDKMIFGKRITPTNTMLMARRIDWIYNTVYARYDDRDPELYKKDFYVVVEELGSYHVFICLDNNKESPSIYAPSYQDTSPDDVFYFTADGYQWKYLYKVPGTTFNKFATVGFMPFVEDSDVTANSIPGSIETIIVDDRGPAYAAYATGFFQEISVGGNNTIFTIEPTSSANTDFYKDSALKIIQGPGAGQQKTILEYVVNGGTRRVIIDTPFADTPSTLSKYEITPNIIIDGDGTGALARAVLSPGSNTISHIEISNTGIGYSYATCIATGNTGVLVPSTSEQTVLRTVLGPPAGFGGDVPKTLHINTVGIAVEFANTELGTIPAENKFRTVGVISRPSFANVEMTVSSITGIFVDGERIFVGNNDVGVVTFYDAGSAVLRVTDNKYPITISETIRGALSNTSATVSDLKISGFDKSFNTFDQRLRLGITLNSSYGFLENDTIYQNSTNASGVVESSNSTFIGLTQVRGTFNTSDVNHDHSITGSNGASANVSAIIWPDIVKNSGQIMYIENIQPVQRADDTSETIKLNITFTAK